MNQRSLQFANAVRRLLGNTSDMVVMSTTALAQRLAPGASELELGKYAQVLTQLAPHLQGYATHDGEEVVRGPRRWRRWQWHGQRTGDSEFKHEMED